MDDLSNKLKQLELNILNAKIRFMKRDIKEVLDKLYTHQIHSSQYLVRIYWYKSTIQKSLNTLVHHTNKESFLISMMYKKQCTLNLDLICCNLVNKYKSEIYTKFNIIYKMINLKRDTFYKVIRDNMIYRQNVDIMNRKILRVFDILIEKFIKDLGNINRNKEGNRDICTNCKSKEGDTSIKDNKEKDTNSNINVNTSINKEENTININKEEYNNKDLNMNKEEDTIINTSIRFMNTEVSHIITQSINLYKIHHDKIKYLLLCLNTRLYYKILVEFSKMNVENRLLSFEKVILLENNNKINDSTTSNILREGDIEDDRRFMSMMNDTIRDIEKYNDPLIVRMGIQFMLARKYVDDIIKLKKGEDR